MLSSDCLEPVWDAENGENPVLLQKYKTTKTVLTASKPNKIAKVNTNVILT